MNEFVTAFKNVPDAYTENGMRTYSSSLDAAVDFFYNAPASRRDQEQVLNLFSKAYREEPALAVKLMLWLRDVRGGAGERKSFRTALLHLEKMVELNNNLLDAIIQVGRADDLLVLERNTDIVATYILNELTTNRLGQASLFAKWMPRKGVHAERLRKAWGLSPKNYRKLLVGLTDVVEQKMCAGMWEKIEYAHLPSLAASRYQKAFSRHDTVRYGKYVEALEKGEATINASSIFPHDVYVSAKNGGAAAQAQWKALPDYMNDNKIIPIVDVSGSMTWFKVGGSLVPLEVAVCLGIYCAERNKGPYKNMMMSFSSDAEMFTFKDSDTLMDKFRTVSGADWGGSTNIMAAFKKILDLAVKNNVPQEDMPSAVLIISDMEFDMCTDKPSNTAMDSISAKYAEAGYKLPKVIFWNMQARNGGVPARSNTKGVALVAGYSPAILKAVMANSDAFTPRQIMLDTVNVPRYEVGGYTD